MVMHSDQDSKTLGDQLQIRHHYASWGGETKKKTTAWRLVHSFITDSVSARKVL